MDRQALRDWVHRYNADGVPGLADRHGGGPTARLSAEQEADVAGRVRAGPDVTKDKLVRLAPALRPVPPGDRPRWRCARIQARIAELFGISLHERSAGRPLHRLRFSRVSTRPRHPKADAAAQASSGPGCGQARRSRSGSRMKPAWASLQPAPRVLPPGDRCATGAAPVLPCANADAVALHLAEISRNVAAGAHGLVVLDGAGWHQTGGRLRVPDNISLPHLPPYSPELNPVENVWDCLRDNKLSNGVFDTYDTVVDRCCAAWTWLMDAPDRIRSIAATPWTKTLKA